MWAREGCWRGVLGRGAGEGCWGRQSIRGGGKVATGEQDALTAAEKVISLTSDQPTDPFKAAFLSNFHFTLFTFCFSVA